MFPNLKPSDKITVVGKIDPDAAGAGSVSTGWVKASDFHEFLAIVQAGDLGASATLDAKLEQATDGSGTGAKNVTGSLITQLTQAGSDSDKIALINIANLDKALDVANSFDYIRLTLTVGVAASEIAGLLLGISPRYGVASHIAAVDEVVSV
jgi:hypothetical protein